MPGALAGDCGADGRFPVGYPLAAHRTSGAHVPGERRLTTDTVGPLGLAVQAIAPQRPMSGSLRPGVAAGSLAGSVEAPVTNRRAST